MENFFLRAHSLTMYQFDLLKSKFRDLFIVYASHLSLGRYCFAAIEMFNVKIVYCLFSVSAWTNHSVYILARAIIIGIHVAPNGKVVAISISDAVFAFWPHEWKVPMLLSKLTLIEFTRKFLVTLPLSILSPSLLLILLSNFVRILYINVFE